jgi:hypothetical protein
MPESVTDRPASALEYVFQLSKSESYFFDMEAVRQEPQRIAAVGWKPNDLKKYSCDPRLEKQGSHKDWRKYCPSGEVGGRNFRNTDLYYESITPPHGLIFAGDEPVGLDVNPQSFKKAHFATFAEKLVLPLIKAGTSEKGCCPECGGPWVRVIEKTPVEVPETTLTAWQRGPGSHDKIPKGNYKGKHSKTDPQAAGRRILKNTKAARDAGGDHDNPFAGSKTIGWKPSCTCGTEHPIPQEDLDGDPTLLDDFEIEPYLPIPCTVLDPFSGSGRTLIVAKKLGRKGIGIDLKPDYLDMSKGELAQEVLEF